MLRVAKEVLSSYRRSDGTGDQMELEEHHEGEDHNA